MDAEQRRAVEALLRMQFPLPAEITIELVAGAGTRFRVVTERAQRTLFIGQAVTSDPRQRAKIVRDFERHALTEAYTVPLLWWNRIVATSASLKGWAITPSHFIGQDLTDVWLEH